MSRICNNIYHLLNWIGVQKWNRRYAIICCSYLNSTCAPPFTKTIKKLPNDSKKKKIYTIDSYELINIKWWFILAGNRIDLLWCKHARKQTEKKSESKPLIWFELLTDDDGKHSMCVGNDIFFQIIFFDMQCTASHNICVQHKEANHLWNFNFNHFARNYSMLKYAKKKNDITQLSFCRCCCCSVGVCWIVCYNWATHRVYASMTTMIRAQWFIVSLWHLCVWEQKLNKSSCMRNICKGEH